MESEKEKLLSLIKNDPDIQEAIRKVAEEPSKEECELWHEYFGQQ